MATFDNGESGSSIRTKINNVLQHMDGTSGAIVVNDAGADVDFRVESDTQANALFVDGATGNVGIGTGSPAEKLHVVGGIALGESNQGSGRTLQFHSAGGGSHAINFGEGTTNNLFSINYDGSRTSPENILQIRSSGNNIATFTEGGNLLVGTTTSPSGSGQIVANGGIYLGGTVSANLLDDYEEGTWTPVLTGSTSGTLNLTGGSYTKIGELVTVRVLQNSAIASGTLVGNLSITGLPFAVDNFGAGNHFCQSNGLLHIRGATTGGTAGAPFATLYGTEIKLHSSSNLGSATVLGNAAPTFSATGIAQNGTTTVVIDWIFTYTVA